MAGTSKGLSSEHARPGNRHYFLPRAPVLPEGQDQPRHCTTPVHAVTSTTMPNAIRYHANGAKLWVEM